MCNQSILTIINTLRRLASSVQNYHSSEEQTWIIDHLHDAHLKQCAQKLSVIGLHALSALENGECTGIDLARKINVSRSGITKAAKIMLANQLITTHQHPANQKKIYYQLTKAGKQIARIHDQMHQQLRTEIIKELSSKFPEADLQTAAQVLQTLLNSEKQLNK